MSDEVETPGACPSLRLLTEPAELNSEHAEEHALTIGAQALEGPRIGVLTYHRCINYGSYWQARCLLERLRAQGLNAVLLDHASRRVEQAELKCALQPLLPLRSPRTDLILYAEKTRRFIDAAAALPRSARFDLHDPACMESFDLVIVGSDEVWNPRHPWYGGCSTFYGGGLRAKRLVSYAASFGNHDAAEGLGPQWAEMLRAFDSISVRDDNSRRLVADATGREPELVLDPCLLFPPHFQPLQDRADEPYVLVYGHSFARWFADGVRRACRDRGYRLLSIGYRNDWADEQRLHAGPEEFAQAVAGAAAVATGFFHGCVFALLNGKPLVCAPSEYRRNKINDLASALGCRGHVLSEDSPYSMYTNLLSQRPDVEERLGALRRSSDNYLARTVREL